MNPIPDDAISTDDDIPSSLHHESTRIPAVFDWHAACVLHRHFLHSERRCDVAHVVAEPCVDCKYTDCVVVCPMECFYGDERQLYIDAEDCIDCGACVPECPVEAIFLDANIPEKWQRSVTLNVERVAVLKPLGMRITEKTSNERRC